MSYIDPTVLRVFKGGYNLGVFFRLGTTPALHLSFSDSDIPIGFPGLDEPGTIYQGAGRLIGIPALETLINAIAGTITFTLSGVDPQAVALMFDSAPEVLGAQVSIGIAAMDERYQPTSPIIPIWNGTADFAAESAQMRTDPTKNQTQSVSLTASTGDQSRQFQNLLTFSDLTQRTLHPGDNFCSRTPRYQASTQITWPRF